MEALNVDKLLTKSVELEKSISLLHQKLKLAYSPYFAELESVSLSPIQYAKIILLLINGNPQVSFKEIVSPSTELVLSLLLSTNNTSRTTNSTDLLNSLCKELIHLSEEKIQLMQLISQEMERIAPNVTALVGSTIASLLLVSTGSLESLSKVPSCNLQLIGKETGSKSVESDYSTEKNLIYNSESEQMRKETTVSNSLLNSQSSNKHSAFLVKPKRLSHSGYLGESCLVVDQPVEYQRRALRLLASKCSLCARLDLFKQYPTGSQGLSFREEIEGKLEKMQEPAPYKQTKPLAAPKDIAGKRRGGRRARKQKQLLATTEVRRLQNKVAFGKPELEVVVGDEIEGLGMLTEESKLQHTADHQLRDSIKKLANKNKIFSSFNSTVNVAPKVMENKEKKFKWF